METLASNISDILYHSGNQNIIGPVDAISLSCDKFESNVTRIDRVSGGKRNSSCTPISTYKIYQYLPDVLFIVNHLSLVYFN